MNIRKPIQIQEVFRLLEMPQNSFNPIVLATKEGNPELAQQLFSRLKIKVKKQRRLLSRKYHPDINPKGEEIMKLINRLCDDFLGMKLMFPQPQPTVQYYHTYTYYGQATSSANVYSTTNMS